MSAHPIFTEQEDDEDWTDWYLRQLNTVADNPPAAPDGFMLLPCEATPRHWPTYVLDDGETGGYALCHYCADEVFAAGHRTCDHDIKHRGAWRRWRATRKVLGKLYAFGVLGVRRETYRCWRAGHRRGEEIGMGFCGKCLPQPCCGHTGSGHKDDCDQKGAF